MASAIKWSYGKNIDTKCEYKIIAIHKHSENDIEKLALIENYYNSFIISLEWLEKV